MSFEQQFRKLAEANPKFASLIAEHSERFLLRYPRGRKECCTCQKEHSIAKFRIKNAGKGLLRSSCAKANLEGSRRWYQNNRESCIERSIENKRTTRQAHRVFVSNALKSKTCDRCGAKHSARSPLTPYQDSSRFKQTVWMAVGSCLSQEAVKAALERSELLCRSCLTEQSSLTLESHFKRKAQILEEGSDLKIFPTQHKDTYRAYRRRIEIRDHLPITKAQSRHMKGLARRLSKGHTLYLLGDITALRCALREAKDTSPQKRDKRKLNRLRKSIEDS